MTCQNYDPAYCEELHSRIMDEFHTLRKQNGNSVTVEMDGIILSKIIGSAKVALYLARPDAKDAGKVVHPFDVMYGIKEQTK